MKSEAQMFFIFRINRVPVCGKDMEGPFSDLVGPTIERTWWSWSNHWKADQIKEEPDQTGMFHRIFLQRDLMERKI